MASISFNGLNSLYINGKEVQSALFNGKQIKFKNTITFNTNMASGKYYYISGQSGTATTVAPPAAKYVASGSAIGTLPTLGNYTYTLSGVSYTIYVEGWYSDQNLTTQVTAATVPTSDMTLYAKWKMTGNVTFSANITCPKFAGSIYFDCYTVGGSRSAKEITASSKHVNVCICAPGAQRGSVIKTFTDVKGKAVTIGTYSCTVGTESASTSQPGAAGTWNKDAAVSGTIIASSYSKQYRLNSGTTTYSSGNYKVIYSWPTIYGGNSGNLSVTYYYANASKGTHEPCRLDVGDDDDTPSVSMVVTTRTKSGTFASGTYGATGAYGYAAYHTSSVSKLTISAASGTGTYSRTLRVQP